MEEKEFSFALSEEQGTMKETVARLMKDLVAGQAHDMDEKKTIPAECIQKIWDLGAVLSFIPEEYGGYGMEYSPVMNALVLEELAAADMGVAIAAMTPAIFLLSLLESGTEEQKKKYIPPYCGSDFRPCSAAVNEPRFRFDPVELETMAEKKGSAYILNGTKCFVPLAKDAGHLLVAADVEGTPQLFIVSCDNPGITIGEREKNLGLYALDTYRVTFDTCEVPAEDMLGGVDSGCYERFLQKSRIAMSALGTGISRASFEYARDYSRERVQFGEPIASRQSVAFMIAEMAYEVDAMRLMTWRAASLLENGKDAKRESFLAKFYAGDMTMKITDFGVQILGGHGFIRDHPVERYYRNGRGIAILEGMATV